MDGMTARGPAPGQRAEAGMRDRFDADTTRRTGAVRQPSLLQLLSLTDWPRFVPETLGLLLGLSVLRSWIDAGTVGPSSLPHAFWIPVLLMAAQYGIMGSLFAALSASLLFLATDLPTQSAGQDFYDYAAFAAAQPCAWFAVALALGSLRTLHIREQGELTDQLQDTRAAAEEFAERLTGAAREMALFEQRIAADIATTSVLLDALAGVDLSSRHTLLASFADVVCHGAGAASFAIHLREGSALVPCFGFEAGAPVPRTALGSLPQLPDQSCHSAPASMPILVPIRITSAADPIGFLFCTRLTLAQRPDIAAHRLHEICRVLAKLLVVCTTSTLGHNDA